MSERSEANVRCNDLLGVTTTDWYAVALERLGWTECTLWFRPGTDPLSFNHLELGHSKADQPTAVDEWQAQQWKNQKWSKRWTFMDKSNVVLS